MKTSKIIKWYFAISFLVYLALTAGYGGINSDAKQSPLYNTEYPYIREVFVHLPIFALLWPLWAALFYGLFDWLPSCFSRAFKKQG